MKKLTEKQFIKFLRSLIKFDKTQTNLASERKLSKSVLSQTLSEQISPSAALAEAFGYRKVTEIYFVKK